MKHTEHVHLIKKAISKSGGVWADFGSGVGAFTLALRELTGRDVTIYSVDKDEKRLQIQEQEFNKAFPKSLINYVKADFTKPLQLPLLDGILMANSLHYVINQHNFLISIQKYLTQKGKLVVVEYNIDTGSQWVPYPLSFETFARLAMQTGFEKVDLLEKIPSTYWEEMYSAQAKGFSKHLKPS